MSRPWRPSSPARTCSCLTAEPSRSTRGLKISAARYVACGPTPARRARSLAQLQQRAEVYRNLNSIFDLSIHSIVNHNVQHQSRECDFDAARSA